MGAGKTAVGRALAKALDLPFADSDLELERRTGVDVAYVFEREGEAGFRRREAELIVELAARERLVLATGGGAVLAASTRALLHARGRVVFLAATIAQQLARTRRTARRPLLATPDPAARLAELYAIREPLYREVAHFEVATDGRRVAALVAEIRARLAD